MSPSRKPTPPHRLPGARAGVSVPELIVALTLGLFVVHLAWSTLRSLDRFEARARGRGDAMLSARVVRSVLRGELAHAVPGRDWWATPDSLSLRAFRGVGIVCAPVPDSASVVLVGWSGERLPEPAKDSLEVVGVDGSVGHVDLLGASPSADACPRGDPGEAVLALTTAGSRPSGPVAVRAYERGSYHLTNGAFRYRLGAGGRQPLTPEVWASGTRWVLDDSIAGVVLRAPEGRGEPWGGFVAWRLGT
jgi:hypothetical protein